jgi:hypothetical protein
MREDKGKNNIGDVIRVGLQIKYMSKESSITYIDVTVV